MRVVMPILRSSATAVIRTAKYAYGGEPGDLAFGSRSEAELQAELDQLAEKLA